MALPTQAELYSSLRDFVKRHPVATELSSSPTSILLNEVFAIPKHIAKLNVTEGVLRGPLLLRTAPIVIVDNSQQTVFAAFSLGNDLAGYPGITHGGIIAMLLDEVMGKAGLSVLGNASAFTAKLDVKYLKPVPVDDFAIIIAKVSSVEERKLWITAVVEGSDPGVTCAHARMLLIKFKEAKI